MYSSHRKNIFAFLFTFICMVTSSTITSVFARNNDAFRYTIQITLDGVVVTGTLQNTPTVRDFVAQLPLRVKLDDYSATEKITYLANKLTTQGAPAGITPNIGDIAYYAPWGNIAIFYQSAGYSPGLIKLGEITHGLEHVRYRGSKQAIIQLIDKN